jgi:hypothetical protein
MDGWMISLTNNSEQVVKIGRKEEKRWGRMLACLNNGAIHKELASSLTTDLAIMAATFRGGRSALKKMTTVQIFEMLRRITEKSV